MEGAALAAAEARTELRQELARVVREGLVGVVFQPLVSLDTGRVWAYEALARGPSGSPLERPDRLFSLAERAGLLIPLERVCRRRALEAKRAHLPPGARLCLNVDPRVIHDPHFRGGVTMTMLAELGIGPREIVLEITERAAIADFPTFLGALRHYRDQGYSVALDDVGAGYASLRALVEVRPSLIKLDADLVRGVSEDPVRRELLAALVEFARRTGTLVAAEGIETGAELAAVRALGVDLAQGFFLARPALPPPPVNPEALRLIV